MTQEEYIRTRCEKRTVPAELELEIHKLWDRKAKTNKFPVTAASYIIDKLKDCPKKSSKE